MDIPEYWTDPPPNAVALLPVEAFSLYCIWPRTGTVASIPKIYPGPAVVLDPAIPEYVAIIRSL